MLGVEEGPSCTVAGRRLVSSLRVLGLVTPLFLISPPAPRCTRCLGEMLVQTDTASGGPFI